ncbi:KilA-N domain-containing protein [Chitiniphilus shinanonensis]|uniref:KilA-N domain-containing protein n=1 Tax=Chitiniphilus shinanonensis TaxID=553088 RepID=UPI0030506089
MTTALVTAEYKGVVVTFDERGWINATEIAEKYGKRPVDWVRLGETQTYLAALARALGISEPKSLIRAKRNSGTWLHPKLGVRFAQWLDVEFAVWCDLQIEALLAGAHPHYDWKRIRHEAASTCKVRNQVLLVTRQRLGKTCAPHHFSNEARMVNHVLTGQFAAIDRDSLEQRELDLLAKLETFDAVLIGCGTTYEERKRELEHYAHEERAKNTLRLN